MGMGSHRTREDIEAELLGSFVADATRLLACLPRLRDHEKADVVKRIRMAVSTLARAFANGAEVVAMPDEVAAMVGATRYERIDHPDADEDDVALNFVVGVVRHQDVDFRTQCHVLDDE
jgi:hypothetical protein